MRWFVALAVAAATAPLLGCRPPSEQAPSPEAQSAEVEARLTQGERERNRIEAADPYAETDVEALISIRRHEHVAEARRALVTRLWGSPGLPASLPERGDHGAMTKVFDGLENLAKAESWVVPMDGALESIVFVLTPQVARTRSACVVIYHESHESGGSATRRHLGRLLGSGCHVALVNMPLKGPNPKPDLVSSRFGRVKLDRHDQMAYVRPEHGHAMKYFLEPVVVMTNHFERQMPGAEISMMGVSGGGWTTTLSAAIDPRISKSFPVAGSYPVHLRALAPWDWGDWEQTVREVYAVVNYPELYVLGASGTGRKQLQILNQFDPCCFSGIKSNAYKDVVARRVRELGAGEFEVLRDDSHRQHEISPAAMDRILAEISSTP